MPYKKINGANLYYEEHGAGEETIVFSHGLLMSGDMFSDQVRELSSSYRCISFDHRGQARSQVTASGYDMNSLTDDAAALIQALDASPCHFAGLSMGGFVGMRLAIRKPELLRSLILMETTADPEPPQNRGPYRKLAFIGRWLGFRLVVDRLMNIMFSQSFLNNPEKGKAREHWREHLLGLNKKGTSRAAHAVIDRQGVYDELDRIDLPTLIMVGDEDVATVPAKSERMHAAIRDSKLVLIPQAGHSASIEEPEAVTRAIGEFLMEQRRTV